MIALSPSTTIQAVCDEIAGLRRQIAVRDTQINLLMKLAFIGDKICQKFGLRKQEYRLLFHLVARAPAGVKIAELTMALYQEKEVAPESNVASVVMSRLRKKLEAHGVEIKSGQKFGFRLDEENLARLRQVGWALPD